MRGRLPLPPRPSARSVRGGGAAREVLAVPGRGHGPGAGGGAGPGRDSGPGHGARLASRLARLLRAGPVLAACGAVLAGASASLPAVTAAMEAGAGAGTAPPGDLPVMRPPDLDLRAM